MAEGRTVSTLKTILAMLGLVAIPVTYGLVTGWNPLPNLLDRLNRVHSLSQPPTQWTVRVGDQPSGAIGEGDVVVLFEPSLVDGRDAASGRSVWTSQADWSAVAGSGASAVVVVGQRGKGYQALDPSDGRVRWRDSHALGVWTYTDLIVSVSCTDEFTCTLTGRRPGDGSVRWQAGLPGSGRPFAGANKALADLGDLGSSAGPARPPRPVPALLGFPLDDQVAVYASGSGQRLHTYRSTSTDRVAVAGTVVLVTSARYRDGNCRFSVTARDPAGDRQVWSQSGDDLRTSSGLGCDQRRNPVGGGGLVAAVTPDNRDALLDVATGREVYRAAAGQTVLATDGRVILVRSADRTKVEAVRRGDGTVLWSRAADRHVGVALTAEFVLFDDADQGRLTAASVDSGRILVDAKTPATVLGYAAQGLILHVSRTLGLLPYGSVAP